MAARSGKGHIRGIASLSGLGVRQAEERAGLQFREAPRCLGTLFAGFSSLWRQLTMPFRAPRFPVLRARSSSRGPALGASRRHLLPGCGSSAPPPRRALGHPGRRRGGDSAGPPSVRCGGACVFQPRGGLPQRAFARKGKFSSSLIPQASGFPAGSPRACPEGFARPRARGLGR